MTTTLPRGLLRLHGGSAFGMHQLTPAIPRFLDTYPDVELELTINDLLPGPAKDHFDLIVRIGTLDDSSLIARRICDVERVICAANCCPSSATGTMLSRCRFTDACRPPGD